MNGIALLRRQQGFIRKYVRNTLLLVSNAFALACLTADPCFGQSSYVTFQESNLLLDRMINPGLYGKEGNTGFSVNLFATQLNTGSTAAKFGYFSMANHGFKHSLLGRTADMSGFVDFKVMGPGLMYKKSGFLVAINTQNRVFGSFSRQDSRLISEINEDEKPVGGYPFHVSMNQPAIFKVNAFNEISVSSSGKILETDRARISAGLAVKYLSALGNSSLVADNLQGDVRLNAGGFTYLVNASGNVSMVSNGQFLDNPKLSDFFSLKNGSAAFDLGISFEYGKVNQTSEPKVLLGLSVTDIGRLKYTADSTYSKTYALDIPENSREAGLYFNGDFQNIKINKLTEIFDKNSRFFKRLSATDKSFKVTLPSILHANTSIYLNRSFRLLAGLDVPINNANEYGISNNFTRIYTAPQYRRGNTILMVPITYNPQLKLSAGSYIRYKGFFIGSSNLLSSVFNTSKQLDLSLGIQCNFPSP